MSPCASCLAVRGQVEFVVLTDEVHTEAMVWRLVDEGEAGSKVKMACSRQRVIGPEHHSAVSGRLREVDALVDQAAASVLGRGQRS